MHNILRSFVSATSLLMDASDEQIDQRGRTKAVSTVWAEMPNMSADVIKIAEQLLDDPSLAAGEPCKNERQWLKAVIDEVGTTSEQPPQSDEESWSSIARFTAWLAFCLNQSKSYAKDSEYGQNGFSQICKQIEQADDYEKSILTAAITEASAHLGSQESESSKEIVSTYDELVRGLG